MVDGEHRKWIVERPNPTRPGGYDLDIVRGPAREPPICCGDTPLPSPKPDFVGERTCGGCSARWIPT